MGVELLPLVRVGTIVDRDGQVGPNAYLLSPWGRTGFWRPDGQQPSFPRSQVDQNTNPHYGPIPMPDNYEKGACGCDCGGIFLGGPGGD